MSTETAVTISMCTNPACRAKIEDLKTRMLGEEIGPADAAHRLMQFKENQSACQVCEGTCCILDRPISVYYEKDQDGFKISKRYYAHDPERVVWPDAPAASTN